MPWFEPPSWEEGINTRVKPFSYFRTTVSASVVRVEGTFTTIRTPSVYQTEAAGAEGKDFFLGGRIYTIDEATASELEVAGYTVNWDEGPGVLVGFGVGGFGEGGFGE